MLNANITADFIAQNFSRSHATYGKSAVVQHQICQKLIDLIREYLPNFTPKSVLEIGCGVGNLTNLYRQIWQINSLYLNDLYDVNLNIDAQFIIGDIERLSLPKVDLVISSSALQWIKDLQSLCQRIYDHLPDSGVFAFATFGQDNLHQIKSLTGRGLEYHGFDALQAMLHKLGFSIIMAKNESYVMHFNDPKDVLRHIKDTGVSVGGATLTKSLLYQFCKDYQDKFATYDADGQTWQYPLTYDAIFILAIKN